MRVARLLSRVALPALLLLGAACGSANTEGPLQGKWFGPSLDGKARRLDFDGGGRILAYSVDGNPTGLTGWIKHIDGLYYEIKWTEEEEEIGKAAFLLGSTGEHAAFYDPDGSLAALQHGADSWNPDGYAIEDFVSVHCAGDTWFLASDSAYVGEERSQMDVFGDATYEGDDTGGRLFQSPLGEALELIDGARGIYLGAYEDQFRGGEAELNVLMTPDKLFAVVLANWPPWTIEDGWTGTWVIQDVVEPPVEPLESAR